MDMTPDVIIEIDELDLTDVPAGRRPAVAAAFQRELARLISSQPPAAQPSERVPVVQARPDGNPVLFGAALARAVHRGLR